jgi:very-short-patch-repair endonuclease
MRKKPTDAEARLWSVLRFRPLDGHRFRRQRPVAGYIIDFYCPSRRLAIELDGGQHAEEAQAEYDRIRTARLNEAGVRVVRFWDHDVLRDMDWVVEEILRQLKTV